jgi:hypothetical protein
MLTFHAPQCFRRPLYIIPVCRLADKSPLLTSSSTTDACVTFNAIIAECERMKIMILNGYRFNKWIVI